MCTAWAENGKTSISDTIYLADGRPAAGQVVITWPSFTTAANQTVGAGSLTQTIGIDGKFAADLYPTEGAKSGSVHYRVVLKLSDGTSSTEYWSVPDVPSATIAAIRSKVVPTSVAVQFASRSDLITRPLDSAVVHNSGDEQVRGNKTFLQSPQVPTPASATSAAPKSYVDSAVAGMSGSFLNANDAQPIRLNGIRYADKFANIQAAVTDAGTMGGVTIPPTYTATDTWTNPNGRPIFNLTRGAKSITGYVNASVFCRFDNSTDNTSCLQAAINYYRDTGSPIKPKSGKVLIDGGAAVISGTIDLDSMALECMGWGSSTDVLNPNGVIRWATGAPSGIPMIKVGGQGSRIENCRIAGNSANPPSAYIEVSQTASTGTQTNYVTLRNNWLGYFGYDTVGGSTGQATDGIIFTGTVNTDSNYLEKNVVTSVSNACLKFTNSQASDDHIDTFDCYGAPYGIWTAADIIGTNWFFSGTTKAAIYLEYAGSVSVRGVAGEDNRALLHQKSFSRAFIDMDGWQIHNNFYDATDNPNYYVIDAALAGDSCAGYTETVIRNFDFRNVSSPALPYKIHWGNAGNNCRQGGELILDFVGGIGEDNLDLAGVGSHSWDLRKVYLRKKPDGNGDPGTVAQNILHAGETFDQYRNDWLGKNYVWGGVLRTRIDPVQIASCTATGGIGTTYSYKVWGKTGTFTSAVQTCTVSGNSTLDSTHYNTITIAPTARGYDTYCYAGRAAGSELQIACVRAGTMSSTASANAGWKFKDDGSVTPSGAFPTSATAGRIESEGGIYSDTFGGLVGNVTANNAWTFGGNIANSSAGGTVTTTKLNLPNCSSSASPAVCTSSASGTVALPAAGTTLVVNTTAVTANSNIFIFRDDSLGTRLSVTCNTQSSLTLGAPRVTARTAGSSFTISVDVAPTTNPMCLSYQIIN